MIDLPRSQSATGIAFHQSGAGAPMLLIHGVGLRAESWHLQIADLQRNFEVFAIDLPGHGASNHLNRATPGLADFSDTIGAFISIDINGPVIVVGHSMGAMIALDLATRHRKLCAGVVAFNGVYRRTSDARQAVRNRAALLFEGHDRLSGELDIATAPIARWFGSDPAGSYVEAATLCRRWLMQVDRDGYGTAYSVFAQEDGPHDRDLARLAIPALFLTGELDANSTPEMSTLMAKKVAQGSAVTIAGAGHMAQMTHGREVNAAVRAFLSRIPQQPGNWPGPSDEGN